MNKDFINNRIECCECNKFLLIEDRISDGDYPYNYLKYSDQVYLFCNDCYEDKMKEEA